MLKKRLVGVVTVKDGWAVQSMSYCRYLPLGKPEVVVENLDRWGVDEIFIQCIDRRRRQAGPDFDLLVRLGALGLSTPLIYGGGICSVEHAVRAVRVGADRLALDSMLWDAPAEVQGISRELGAQALIAHMPVSAGQDRLMWMRHLDRIEADLTAHVMARLPFEWVSEVMLADWRNEGGTATFNEDVLSLFSPFAKPLIAFGGISSPSQIQRILGRPDVVAVAVGNSLSYREHAVQSIKSSLVGIPMRPECYMKGEGFR